MGWEMCRIFKIGGMIREGFVGEATDTQTS